MTPAAASTVRRWLLAALLAEAAAAAAAQEAVVLDGAGQPMASASVFFEPGQTVHCDAQGRVKLPAGVAPEAAQLTLREHRADGYYVLHGPWQEVLRPYRVPYQPLDGQVVRADGSPVSGARVTAEMVQWAPDRQYVPPPPARAGWQNVTTADGRFRLTALPRGSDVTVAVEPPGRLPPGRFRLAPARARCRLAPEAGGVVVGRLLEPDGRPAFGLRLVARQAGTGRVFRATTAADGRFTLDLRADGEYRLSLEGAVWWVAAPEGSPPLVLRGNARGDLGELTLRALVPLWVQARGGDPAERAKLPVYWAPTGSNGCWETAPVGRRLAADGPTRLMVAPGPARVTVGQASQTVDVPPAGLIEPLVVDLGPSGAKLPPLRVRVVDRSGADVKSAQISLDDFREPRTIKREPDGAFVVPLRDAVHPVTINLGCAESALVATRVVPATPGQTVRLLLDVPGYATVQGRVVDTAGQPVAGADVTLERIWPFNDFAEAGGQTVTTRADGCFAFGAVGTWLQVRLSVRRGAEQVLGDAWLPPSNGDADSGVRDFGDVRIGLPRAELTGTVVDTAGQPVAGVTVLALVARGPAAAPRALTDAAGTFTLRGLPAGGTRVLAVAATTAGGCRTAERLAVPGQPAVLVLQPWRWPTADLRDTALDTAQAVWDSGSTTLRTAVVPLVARLDPAACLALLDSLPAAERERFVAPVVEAVAQAAGAGVLRGRLAELNTIAADDRRWLALARVACFLAPTDRKLAAQTCDDLAGVEVRGPQQAAFEVARARLAALLHRPAAAAWAAAAGTAVAARPGWVRNVGVRRLAPWLAEWPELLARLLAALPEPRLATVAHAAAVARLAASQPALAVRWHDEWFPASHDAAPAGTNSGDAAQDQAAAQWVEQDLAEAAGALAASDPQRATAWAELLLGAAARRTALVRIALAPADPAARAQRLSEVAAASWPDDALVLAAYRAGGAASPLVQALLADSSRLATGRFSAGLALTQPAAARLALEADLRLDGVVWAAARGPVAFAPRHLAAWAADSRAYSGLLQVRLVAALVPEVEQLEAPPGGPPAKPRLELGETWSYGP